MLFRSRMKAQHVFFGTSTTLTRDNYVLTTDRRYLRDLLKRGCRLFYYINYIPVEPGTEHLQLPGDRVQAFEKLLTSYRKTMPCLFIAFPHDEIALGGCLAAGRGFVHINAYGDVEPSRSLLTQIAICRMSLFWKPFALPCCVAFESPA